MTRYDCEATRRHDIGLAASRDERQPLAVWGIAGTVIDPLAFDDRARRSAINSDSIESRFIRRAEAAARSGGVRQFAAIGRPGEAVNILRGGCQHSWRSAI